MSDRIIVALDVDSLDQVIALVEELGPYVGYFKVGFELAMTVGIPTVLKEIHNRGGKTFVDCKLNDIPHTVKQASYAVAQQGVSFFTVHATSPKALATAAEVKGDVKLLAVTVLTSFNDEEANLIFHQGVQPTIINLAHVAQARGADGIVCSVRDLAFFNKEPELTSLIKVTPGIRPVWAESHDQQRIATPSQAVKLGADYIVVGRPITHPPTAIGSPKRAAQLIAEEMV